MLRKIFITIFFCFLYLSNFSFAKENRILFKINNEIITSVDILNEIKYLKMINKDFNNTEKKTKIEIATNSLIREKIKKNELKSLNINLKVKDELFEEIIQNNFRNLNIKTLEEFNLFFKQEDIDPNLIKDKIIVDVMWKQWIYNKFYNKVKIDRNKIKKDILNKKKEKEYLLSEILIETEKREDVNKKLVLIDRTIKEKGFSIAALNFSISESSKNGGKLGWIKENVLSKKIKDQLSLIQTGEYTNPVIIPGGFLILKIEDTRIKEIDLNTNNLLQNIIEKKTNEQLSRFSNIYLNKLKKDTLINEL